MTIASYLAVMMAIFIPALLYFAKARAEQKNIKGIQDFFPLKRSLSTGEYRSTTVAAGMSLATVFIAFINLAPFLGFTLIISVVTFAISFLLLYFFVPKIMKLNPDNESIQTYLGKSYQSKSIRKVAIFFTLIGYISIFCMELIVGVTVLEPFLGNYVIAFSAVYLVFVIVYSLMSGYRAVIATDVWQLRFVVVGIGILYIFAVWKIFGTQQSATVSQLAADISNSWVPAWSFVFGITAMNLPAPISDTGTWQRLCSTRDSKTAQKGVLHVAFMFILFWGALVFIGVSLSKIALSAGFNPASGSLMSWVITSLTSGGAFGLILLFALFLGLFSAMISTADSLLIVAGQLLAIDILELANRGNNTQDILRKARIAMAVIAIISFFLFSIFYLLKFDVVQLVFSVYGAQLAMFPSVLASLCLRNRMDLTKASFAGMLSILCGFSAGWVSALYGKFGGNPNWLYNSPVCALAVSTIVFLLFSIPAWSVTARPKKSIL
ncbi:sodium:solute symporter family transporter [Maridesulfovibrio sp.]|uniref:sodium:solute symporter family transporter n=1 Tax=Maridesulfovibrio sp. TaxID=2795000 RepID=UPI0039F0410F